MRRVWMGLFATLILLLGMAGWAAPPVQQGNDVAVLQDADFALIATDDLVVLCVQDSPCLAQALALAAGDNLVTIGFNKEHNNIDLRVVSALCASVCTGDVIWEVSAFCPPAVNYAITDNIGDVWGHYIGT